MEDDASGRNQGGADRRDLCADRLGGGFPQPSANWPWEEVNKVLTPTRDDPLVWSDLRKKFMKKSEADAWNADKMKMDNELRQMMKRVLVRKGKSIAPIESEVVSQRYTMESLLDLATLLSYEDFLSFERSLTEQEKEELDEESALTIHRCRLYGEHDIAAKYELKLQEEVKEAMYQQDVETDLQDLQRKMKLQLAEDPAFTPRNLIYDDGCRVVPEGRTPKEINDEILRRKQNKAQCHPSNGPGTFRESLHSVRCTGVHSDAVSPFEATVVSFEGDSHPSDIATFLLLDPKGLDSSGVFDGNLREEKQTNQRPPIPSGCFFSDPTAPRQQPEARALLVASFATAPRHATCRCWIDKFQSMDLPVNPIEVAKAYKYKAELLLKDYMLADSYVLYAAVLGGILMCKLVSVGYFIADLAMIFWFYPSLGGMEYVIHHVLSLVCVVYAMLSGEGQLYTYMVLISETTTPGINLRWFLDVAGMKSSKAYVVNGVAMFVTWLIKQMDTFGCLLIFVAPTILFVMNALWFSKIVKGLKKTLAKRHVDFFNTYAEDSKPQIKSSLVLGLSHVRSLFTPSMALLNSTNFDFLDIIEPVTAYTDGYLLSLNLGTPPQVFQVYLDTGSDLSWVPCGTSSYQCLQCGNDIHTPTKPTPTFSPSQSSTNTRDLCGSRFCVDVHSSDNRYDPCAAAGCSITAFTSGLCPRTCPPFSYTYGGGALVLGSLSRDAVTLHGSVSGTGPLPIQFPGFCFGCVSSSVREPIGIAGFGKGILSLPSQLGFLNKGFSHCFLGFRYARNPNITSSLVMGDLALSSVTSEFLFTPMLKSATYPNFYHIGLEAISIGDDDDTAAVVTAAAPPSLSSIDAQGNGGVIVDTGTTYTHLPDPFYASITSSISSAVPYERSRDLETRTGFDLCFKVPCARAPCTADALPPVSLHLAGGAKLTLPKMSCYYPVTAPRDSVVVKCLLFQRMEDDGTGGGPGAVLGSFQMQNVEVVYDLVTGRIGFQPRDCAVQD
ncbi:hypothetical protein PR202_ga05631 [Eleusine coracana subsp. coracana]|uniref:Peptidase A1 domain-containing protein n=1 Tax=Eleusine coracana subsp. coracana TaxID=191504 RepID=A0AAV5BTK1_ELECO|nr:hypothetical protein PR202_ga05177 [Eleusine coracana subsp. coracana]GJM89436.1 hypothetical protein PR202_ga05631 [Eleusine coracana subsp. coracana]